MCWWLKCSATPPQISHMSWTETDPPCLKLFKIQSQRENSSCLHVEDTNLPDQKEYLNIYAVRNSFCSKDRERLNSEHSPVAGAFFQKEEEFKALVLLAAQTTAPTSTQSPSCAPCRKRLSCPHTQCQGRAHLREPDVEAATIPAPQHFQAIGNKLWLFS